MLFKNLFGDVIEIVKEEEPGDFYRVIRFLNSFEETEHPRDKDGKFTDKGLGSSTGDTSITSPLSSITIKENKTKDVKTSGESVNIADKYIIEDWSKKKEYILEAENYLKNKLRGEVIHVKLGKIRISNKGIKEFISHINPEKLPLTYHLKDIIEKGIPGEKVGLKHYRKDGIVAFIPLYTNIKVKGKIKNVLTHIGKDNMGNTFYDLYIRNWEADEMSDQNPGSDNCTPEAETDNSFPVSNSIIENKDGFINLFIKDENGKWI